MVRNDVLVLLTSVLMLVWLWQMWELWESGQGRAAPTGKQR